MKKILFPLLAALALAGCGKNSGYTVSGTLDAQQAGSTVHLLSAGRDRTQIAQTEVAPDGTFTLKGKIDTPMVALLADNDDQPFTMLFLEPGKIDVRSDAQGDYDITGTVSNDRFKAINDTLSAIQARFFALGEGATEEQMEALQDEYQQVLDRSVDENLDNILGVYLFSAVSGELTPAETRERIGRFSQPMQQTELLSHLRDAAQAKENTEIGKHYTDLTLKDPQGQPIALSSLVGPGKWVLLDFWATWCGPCNHEIPFLREAYKNYKDKGFEIYGVSLDNDADAWRSFLPENGMDWVNVIAVEEDKTSPAADTYAIRSIPANFLISPDGIIVAKNLRGEAIEQQLAESIQ